MRLWRWKWHLFSHFDKKWWNISPVSAKCLKKVIVVRDETPARTREIFRESDVGSFFRLPWWLCFQGAKSIAHLQHPDGVFTFVTVTFFFFLHLSAWIIKRLVQSARLLVRVKESRCNWRIQSLPFDQEDSIPSVGAVTTATRVVCISEDTAHRAFNLSVGAALVQIMICCK